MKSLLPYLYIFLAIITGFYIGQATQHLNKPTYLFSDAGINGVNSSVDVYGSFIVKDKHGIVLNEKNDPTGVSGHTVDIFCDYNSMTCTEVQSFIGPETKSIVIGNSKTYEVNNWTSDSITSKPLAVDTCTTEVLHIDRFSKTVTINNSLSNNNECASFSNESIVLTVN
jgi:hypothetical protein